MSNNIDDVIKEKMNDEANKILQENAAAIEEHGAQLAMDLTADGITKDDLFMGQLEDAVTMFEDGTIEGKLNEAAAEMLRTTGSEILSVTDVMQIIDKALCEAMKDIAPTTRKALEVTSEIVKGIWADNAAAIMELAQQEERLKTIEPFIEEELQKAAQEDETLKQHTAHGIMHDYLLLKGGAAEKTPPAIKAIIDRAFTRWIAIEPEQGADKPPAAKKNPKGAKYRAQQAGALTTIGSRAAYLAPQKGVPELALQALSRTCLFYLPTDADINQTIDPKTGRMNPLFLTERRPQENIEEAHTGLFGSLMSAAIQSYTPEEQDKNSFIIYLPDILKELGVDPRTYSTERAEQLQFTDDHGEVKIRTLAELRYNKMLELLVPYDRVVGMMPDGSFYRFLTFGAYKKDTETMEIITPFLFELCRRYDENRYTFLMHSDIANERNQAAVEVVLAILRGLAKRGTTHPDTRGLPGAAPTKRKKTTKKKNGDVVTEITTFAAPESAAETEEGKRADPVFSYEVSYKTIIEECPQLKKALDDIMKGKKTKEKKQEKGTNKADGEKKEEGAAKDKWKLQAVNSKLKQVFTAAFRILFEKTDAPLYYKNLHFTTNVVTDPEGRPIKDKAGNISYILPTNTTLHRKIGLAHNGRNREYKRK